MHNPKQFTPRLITSIILQTISLLLFLNVIFALLPETLNPSDISLYNHLFPGRWRLPWSENPAEAYNITLNNLPALFSSHEVSDLTIESDEFRVLILGDSSVWGFLLEKEDSLSNQLNLMDMHAPTGKPIRFYNLGYPTISLFKDLVLLDQAMAYQPDLIIWFVTLEAFPPEKQLSTSFVQHNPNLANQLIQQYELNLPLVPDRKEFLFSLPLFSQRREIADMVRLQLYGIPWAATGVDQFIQKNYTPLQTDFEADDSFHNYQPGTINTQTLVFDVLVAGTKLAGETPVLFVNEPIYISNGQNSHIRYNFYYPCWAYDEYRKLLSHTADEYAWNYLDLWNLVAPEEFTNTAIHVSPSGVAEIAKVLSIKLTQVLE